MNTDKKRKTPKFGELDKLVNAEIEVLLAPVHQTDERVLDEQERSRSHDPDERVVYPHPFAERRRPDEHPAEDLTGRQPAEIVEVKPPRQSRDGSLFSAEEDSFIASASTWLRGRDNADVVLDEIWRLVIGFGDEGLEDESDPAAVVDEVEEVAQISPVDPDAGADDKPSAPAGSETKRKVARRKPARRKKPKDKKS